MPLNWDVFHRNLQSTYPKKNDIIPLPLDDEYLAALLFSLLVCGLILEGLVKGLDDLAFRTFLFGGKEYQVIISLPVRFHFDLLRLREVHEEQRHYKEDPSNAEGHVLSCFLSLRHQTLNLALNL